MTAATPSTLPIPTSASVPATRAGEWQIVELAGKRYKVRSVLRDANGNLTPNTAPPAADAIDSLAKTILNQREDARNKLSQGKSLLFTQSSYYEKDASGRTYTTNKTAITDTANGRPAAELRTPAINLSTLWERTFKPEQSEPRRARPEPRAALEVRSATTPTPRPTRLPRPALQITPLTTPTAEERPKLPAEFQVAVQNLSPTSLPKVDIANEQQRINYMKLLAKYLNEHKQNPRQGVEGHRHILQGAKYFVSISDQMQLRETDPEYQARENLRQALDMSKPPVVATTRAPPQASAAAVTSPPKRQMAADPFISTPKQGRDHLLSVPFRQALRANRIVLPPFDWKASYIRLLYMKAFTQYYKSLPQDPALQTHHHNMQRGYNGLMVIMQQLSRDGKLSRQEKIALEELKNS